MTSTWFGLEIGKRAIATQQKAMDVTSHNIANANTEGYARQRAVISTTDPWSVPDLNSPVTGQQLGTGVDVTKVESIRDSYIDEKIVRETSILQEYSSADDLMKEVEAILNEPNDTTLRDSLDKFWAAWEDLSVNASSTELRQNLKAQSEALISQFQDIDMRLQRLQGTPDYAFQGSIENQLEDSVKEVNNLAEQIADLNVEIQRSEIGNAEANDLRDTRQKLVEDLSELINLETSYDSNGGIKLRCGTHTLVDNTKFNELYIVKKDGMEPGTISGDPNYPEYSDNPEVASAVQTHTESQRNITLTVSQIAEADSVYSYLSYFPLTDALSTFGVTSGSFTVNGRSFYVDADNTTIQELASMIDTANINVDANVNEAGQLTMTSTLTGTENAITFSDGTSNLATVLNLQVKQEAKDAVFNYNGTEYTTSENVVDDALAGVKLILNGTGVANLDMRPIVTGGKLKGLLEVRDGNIQSLRDKFDEMASKLVTEINDVHRKGFGLNGQTGQNFFKSLATDDPNQPYKDAIENLSLDDCIVSDLNNIAAAQGTLENSTDCLPTYNGDGDGNNAILIAQIKQKNFFSNGKANFSDFYNTIVTEAATGSQKTETKCTASQDLITQLESQRSSVSGVSLDEELTNLVKFQQAYNAAAKIVSVIDEMLDTIINM